MNAALNEYSGLNYTHVNSVIYRGERLLTRVMSQDKRNTYVTFDNIEGGSDLAKFLKSRLNGEIFEHADLPFGKKFIVAYWKQIPDTNYFCSELVMVKD